MGNPSWWIVNQDRGVILTPKCASRSLCSVCRKNSFYKVSEIPKKIGIWVRHPIERVASAYYAAVQKNKKPRNFLISKETLDDHIAPQVDYLNWRHGGGIGCHQEILVGANKLNFMPDKVFFFEELPQSYFDMCEWLGIKKGRLKFKNVKRNNKPLEEVFPKNLDKVLEYYSNDLMVYERLKRDYGSN